MSEVKLKPIHPGGVLLRRFMQPLNLSARKLAEMLNVPSNRISTIVSGKRAISADTAIRLAACFGTTAEFWMNLQSVYELKLAKYHYPSEQVADEVQTIKRSGMPRVSESNDLKTYRTTAKKRS